MISTYWNVFILNLKQFLNYINSDSWHISNGEQLTLNKWFYTKQHICRPAFMFLVSLFFFLESQSAWGCGTGRATKWVYLWLAWRDYLFVQQRKLYKLKMDDVYRRQGQESCLLWMRNARNPKANQPFRWL